jgi:hypothetical protein
MARWISLLMVTGSLGGCASGPTCDWTQLVSTCSAALETRGTTLVVRTASCSQIDMRVNDKARILRSDEGTVYAGSSDDAVEVVSCRSYKDLRLSP